MIDYIFALLNFITNTKLMGIIPLDIFFHFGIGVIFTIIAIRCKFRMRNTMIALLILAVAKEFLDFYRMVDLDLLESSKDIIITMAYPVLVLAIRKMRREA